MVIEMEIEKTLEYKIKTKYNKLFTFVSNAYKNKKEVNKANEDMVTNLFNDLIVDFNSSDYPEDKERCIIYQHLLDDGIKCNIIHNTKIMHLARPRNDRKKNNSNLELKSEAAQYLFFNDSINHKENCYILLFSLFYEKSQNEFNPEEPIESCIFSLFPLNDYQEEERDIGISLATGDEKNSKICKSIIFKSFYIKL
jgi:hypothetical protein